MRAFNIGLLTLLLAAATSSAHGTGGRNVLLQQALPNVPGKTLTMVEVTAPPGAVSAKHHHAGSVAVYVLSGSVRVQFQGQAPRVYTQGQVFYEPPGTEHLSSENLSKDQPLRLLAVFVADAGAELTTYDK
jgi:quercetin dioxygenase-like cupin family protein